jgi:hypothetical protein
MVGASAGVSTRDAQRLPDEKPSKSSSMIVSDNSLASSVQVLVQVDYHVQTLALDVNDRFCLTLSL